MVINVVERGIVTTVKEHGGRAHPAGEIGGMVRIMSDLEYIHVASVKVLCIMTMIVSITPLMDNI